MPSPAIKSIVIAGGGTAGWMTAAALAKVFGKTLDITLIESEEIGTIGVGEATIPAIANFNAMLGIDEDTFMRETQGTFKLGIEFRDWHRRGQGYLHSFGAAGQDFGYIPFHHYWLQDYFDGGRTSLWDYDFNAIAMAQGKFERPRPGAPGLVYAFHFDAGLYAAYLRRYAEGLGVKRIEGKISDVKLDAETGDISGLVMDNATVVGDFFVDCSGFRALLIEGALKTGYTDWSHWLPCDRALAVPCESAQPLTPFTRATARDAGWQWRIPLQHRTGNGHVYASSHMSDDQAYDVLMANLDGKALADPRPIRFLTGRRKQFWNRNCVAIGLSGGFIEPLESTSIHLIQSGIERLIMLFPRAGDNKRLRDEYNLAGTLDIEFIRDFIILHYHANAREGEAFWDACRHMSVPDSLTHKIELFRQSAAIHVPPFDLFRLPSWLQVMLGQGIVPQSVHPYVAAVSQQTRTQFLSQLRSGLMQEAMKLPEHGNYIAQHCRAG